MLDSTLEPPGSIAVIGAGPLGIEAALYGRFLGYDVRLIEAESVGHSMSGQRDQPLPMLPDRCLSPLAVSAINAQSPDSPPLVLPTTIGDWIDNALTKITETDLLRGRLQCPRRVTAINHLPIETDDDGNDEEPLPPDFRLTIEGAEPIDAEAVVLAVGSDHSIQLGFDLPAPYFFQVGQQPTDDAEKDLLFGLKEIVGVFASLGGRETLDLYVRQLPPST